MAITDHSTASTGSTGTETTSLSFSHTVPTGGTDVALIVGVACGTNTTATATYNGVSMTSEIVQGTNPKVTVFSLANPATGANTVAISFSASTEFCGANAFSFAGVDQTTPVEASGGANSSSVAVTTVTDGALVVDTCRGTVEKSISVGAGQTSKGVVTGDSYDTGMSTEPKVTAGSVTMSWTNGVAIAAVVLKPTGSSSTQALTGALYSSSPTHTAGTVAAGTVALTGTAAYGSTPTYNAGTVAQVTSLTGSLHTSAPAHNAGTVTAGTAALAGSLHVSTPTYNAGTVSTGTVALSGSLYASTPTHTPGVVAAGTVALAGSLHTSTPTHTPGTVGVGAVPLTGALYASTPSYPGGVVSLGGGTQTLTGTVYSSTPTHVAGVVAAGTIALTGSLYASTPTHAAGLVAAGAVGLAGSLHPSTPAHVAGTVSLSGGPQGLTGSLHPVTPTHLAGALGSGVADLVGVLYGVSPTHTAGVAAAGVVDLAGVLYGVSPTHPAGVVSPTYALRGTRYIVTPAHAVGTVAPGVVTLLGVVYDTYPTYPAVGVVTLNPASWLYVPPTEATGRLVMTGSLPSWKDHAPSTPRGLTVVNNGGVYTVATVVTPATLASADAYYLGGHATPVSDLIKAELEAAGVGGTFEVIT